ncbi:hypothetical protein BJ944DRAFT_246797 [Cunninghamella echinulata]|nr:hypothetical protein BJ944DRAFT_246797 [Cunninghamella echinulata]
MSVSLSTCYNNLGFGRWEELCHEFMSVLPMDYPRMSFDDLSSPTWHFIFLKDDCFLQPSCEIIASSDSNVFPSNLPSINNHHHHHHHHHHRLDNSNSNNNNMYIQDDDSISTSSSSSQSLYSLISPPTIEPLFDGIDLNQQHNDNENNNSNNNEVSNNNNNSNNKNTMLKINKEKDKTFVHDQQQQKPIPSKKPILITLKRKKRKNHHQQLHSIKKENHQHHQQKRKKHDINKSSTTTTTNTTTTTTLFEQLSQVGIDWCRYCGTTEGVNWRPGPWGKRTLCNKHGCDYKGYGLASRLPRLDLSSYRNENIEHRLRPVIQEFCSICQERGKLINTTDIDNDIEEDEDEEKEMNHDLRLVPCDGGCSRAFHLKGCLQMNKENNQSKGFNQYMENQQNDHLWYCSPTCYDNRKKKKVVVDLPRKQPLMRPLK